MSNMPDLIGYKLEEGLQQLEDKGLAYRLVENCLPGKSSPSGAVKRIVRQRWIGQDEIEIVYSVDTYQLG